MQLKRDISVSETTLKAQFGQKTAIVQITSVDRLAQLKQTVLEKFKLDSSVALDLTIESREGDMCNLTDEGVYVRCSLT